MTNIKYGTANGFVEAERMARLREHLIQHHYSTADAVYWSVYGMSQEDLARSHEHAHNTYSDLHDEQGRPKSE